MGYIRHHAIIVSSYHDKYIKPVHEKAVEIFGTEVSGIVESGINGYCSFFVAPDGSKEGWADSDKGDERRNLFIDHIESLKYEDGGNSIAYSELFYGDDDGESMVTRHN